MNKRTVNWFVVNGLFLSCMIVGYMGGVESAGIIADVLAWITITSSIFISLVPVEVLIESKLTKETFRSVPRLLGTTFDLVITGIFLWYGAIFTGVFYVLHIILLRYIDQKLERGKV